MHSMIRIKSKKTDREQLVSEETWNTFKALGIDRRFIIVKDTLNYEVPKNTTIIEKKESKKHD